MKIAVCLSGESRTYEKCVPNVRHFFEHQSPHEFFYFGHTWSTNSWKIFDDVYQGGYAYEEIDPIYLKNNLQSLYGFTGLAIDEKYTRDETKNFPEIVKNKQTPFEIAANYKKPWTWNPMAYSCMKSNFLKQQYEIDNDMKFDIVVRTRFDQCFEPNTNTFNKYLSDRFVLDKFRGDVLYCEATMFRHDFMQQAINDVFYFGSSRAMDIIETFYRVYHNGNFFKMVDSNYYDGAMKTLGYGPLLYKWAVLKNIYPMHLGRIYSQILRKDSTVENTILEYEKIREEARVWGRKI
jgi:hypothetical protein